MSEPLHRRLYSPLDAAPNAAAEEAGAVGGDLVRGLLGALDLHPDAVVVIDAGGDIVWCNRRFIAWLDVAPTALVGRPLASLAWEPASSEPDIQREVAGGTEDLPATCGWPWDAALANLPGEAEVPLWLQCADDRRRRVACTAGPLREAADPIGGALVVLRDITRAYERFDGLHRAVDSLRRHDTELREQNEHLYALATIDPLSRVFNRRAFFDAFNKHFAEAQDRGTPLACIMCDIDFFKSVNDTFGHALGDEIINHLAKILNDHRDGDGTVGRMGGEEFCLLRPNLDEAAAIEVAETIRLFLESGRNSSFADQLGVTASFGVAALPGPADSPHQLVELADRALYRAKEEGRNRVVGFQTIEGRRDEPSNDAERESDEDEPSTTSTDSGRPSEHGRRRDDGKQPAGARVLVEEPLDASARDLLLENVTRSLQSAGTEQNLCAVMVLDSAAIAAIAHRVDPVLAGKLTRAIVARLSNLLRNRDVVSRPSLTGEPIHRLAQFAGDIVVVINAIDRAESVPGIVERVLGVFTRPILVGGLEYRVDTFAGVSVYGVDGDEASELLHRAKLACSDATQHGGVTRFRFYSQEMDEAARRHIQLQNDLHFAIERDELSLVYQPKLELESGALLGFEVLLRWAHETLGPISPGEFIPIAEHSGQILEITKWVLTSAARQTVAWRDAGVPVVPLAINVSAVELQEPATADAFMAIVSEHELEPSIFEIEITESVSIESHEQARDNLERLRHEGFCVAMDDFGTGYASLNHLQQLPIDRLKIDRCFIDRVAVDQRASRVVRAIISLANSLGMRVLAEGVETVEQLRYLLEEECDEVQGYLLSRPLTPDAAMRVLQGGGDIVELLREARAGLPSRTDASPGTAADGAEGAEAHEPPDSEPLRKAG